MRAAETSSVPQSKGTDDLDGCCRARAGAGRHRLSPNTLRAGPAGEGEPSTWCAFVNKHPCAKRRDAGHESHSGQARLLGDRRRGSEKM